MKHITIDLERCVGCRNCEYACSFEQNGDFDRRDSRIRVNFYPETVTCIPMTCMHCTDGWCLEVCPANAISRDEETGIVSIDEDRCAGCKMCLLACPLGNIHFNTVKLISEKCDLCGGDPNCVKHCISGALQFVEDEKLFESKREHLDGLLQRMIESERITCTGGKFKDV